MTKVVLFSLTGLGGAVGIGGGVYLLNKSSNNLISVEQKESIRNKLKLEGYTPLNPDDNKTHWTESLGKYKAQYSDRNDWNELNLKKRCGDLLGKEEILIEDYKEARKYCVVPKDVSGRLKDLGFRVLDTGETKDTTKWTKLSEEYKKGGDDFKKLNDLEHSQVQDSNGAKLRSKCEEILKKDHWDANYDSLLESSQIWCTEEGFKKLPSQ